MNKFEYTLKAIRYQWNRLKKIIHRFKNRPFFRRIWQKIVDLHNKQTNLILVNHE